MLSSLSHPCVSEGLLPPSSDLAKIHGPHYFELGGLALLETAGALGEAVLRKAGWAPCECPSGGRAYRWLPSTGSRENSMAQLHGAGSAGPSHRVLLPTDLETQPFGGGFVWVYLLLIRAHILDIPPQVFLLIWV